MKTYEYHYLDENNKECYYKGNNDNFNLWEKLSYSYLNSKDQIYKFHRLNGPAYISINNFNNLLETREEYFINGLNHRDDGPATKSCVYNNNILDYQSNIFYLRAKVMDEKDFAEETNHLTCKVCDKFCKQYCLF